MKRFFKSLPFLFIFGLLLWVINSLAASMFIPGKFSLDSALFASSLDNIYTRILIVSFSILLYMILFRIFLYEKDRKFLRNAFNHSFPMCITGFDHHIIDGNAAYWETFNDGKKPRKKIKCHDNRPGEFCQTPRCTLKRIQEGEKEIIYEQGKLIDGLKRYYIIKAKPVVNAFGEVIGCIESFDDITVRKNLERENQHLINNLRQSLEQVKMLKGLLPVCPSCKQVRNDQGYWDRIESYLADHTEAEVLPCLCPECKELSRADLLSDFDELSGPREQQSNDMQWLKVAN